ncbi:hypothetical protein [Kitasatospora sp. NPDC059571]|uniref:hypothetical protein n=1 Tax=Kitasatospora sp. NPDC059571 TaxID=3346871 RepID=UPI0036C3F8E7
MNPPIIDSKPVLRNTDLLAAGLRAAAAARIAELLRALGPVPTGPADRHPREPVLDEDRRRLLAEYDDLVRLREAAGRAWSEDRLVDLVQLADRSRRHLMLGGDLVDAMRRIAAFTDAHPHLGSGPRPAGCGPDGHPRLPHPAGAVH